MLVGEIDVPEFGIGRPDHQHFLRRLDKIDRLRRMKQEGGNAEKLAAHLRREAGAACRDVDRAARQVVDAAGHGEALTESTGHGVGLEIDEDPQLAPAAMGKLDACVPVTVEPGVHLPGRGGVRIDDTLVVRPEADGGPELLTITTKELLAL